MTTRLNASGGGDDGVDAVASWNRAALVAGWAAGVGLVVQTGLYLLDAANVLADQPEFHRTGAGAGSSSAVLRGLLRPPAHDPVGHRRA